MHLRVSEEAERMGLDLDQLYEEDIGDWSLFEEFERTKMVVVEGEDRESETASGSGGDVELISGDEIKESKRD